MTIEENSRLYHLSKISNAVLTPELNCDLNLICRNDSNAKSFNTGDIPNYEKKRIKRWCERQAKQIGLYGAVLSCGE